MFRGGSRRAREALREPLLHNGGPDDEENRPGPRPSMRRLFAEAREEARALVVATLFLVVAASANLAIPLLAGRLIDACLAAQAGGDKDTARRAMNLDLALICAVLLGGALAGGVRAWLFSSAAERVMYRLRVKLFRSIMAQEVGFFDRVRTGELMNRLSEDTRLMKDAATVSIAMALRSFATLVLGMAMMFYTSWRLTAMTMVVLPCVLGTLWGYRRYSERFTAAQLSSSAEAATVAEEVFSSVRTVRSFAKEGAAIARYQESANDVLKWGLSLALAWVFSSTIMFGVAPISLMCIIWYGARLVLDGFMTVGSLNAFILYSITVGSAAGTLASVFANVFQAVGAGARVFELLDRKPRLSHDSGKERPVGQPEGGHLQMQHVWFAYPSRPAVSVLRDFCLDVAPGSKRALVGTSGGGKSTAVHLLERFYDPQQGSVLLDGVDLRNIDHVYLHQQVALVSQEPVLFAETIHYNITFGLHLEPINADGSATSDGNSHLANSSGEAAADQSSTERLLTKPGQFARAVARRVGRVTDQRRVEAAARLANAHDFILSLPEGYATIVGERGVRLSGGQKQRVAIARALLLQPRVLLLDEATSALDAESEFLVQQALDTASAGRTVLVVAHRLSTVQNADAVSVVAEGRIAEQGTHDELLSRGGLYAALVHRQLAGDDAQHAQPLAATSAEPIVQRSGSSKINNGVNLDNAEVVVAGAAGIQATDKHAGAE